MSHETHSGGLTSTTPLLHDSSEPTGSRYTSYQKWLQFQTRRASTLWTLYAFVVAAFFMARIHYIFPGGISKNLDPSEYYQFRIPLNKLLLWLHLASVLPAALLAVIQFIPRVRARAMSFHRTAGKVVNILTFVSTLSAWGIERVSFGGDLGTQAVGYVFGVMVLWSTVASWKAIRRLQIDEHRIWIIRAWGYQMSIMTARVVIVAAMIYMLVAGGFYQSMSCREVEFILNGTALYERNYPQCQAEGPAPQVTYIAVEANLSGLGIASALRQTAGMATWVALWIHAIGVEYYLYQTKDESARLREVSTKRQHARRMLEERQGDSE